MSTIELVDPELRDALTQLLPPLTAESLTQRRANALELAAALPKPNLPDIATDEIHVESAFGAKPIRVLAYRPVTSNDPLPAIVYIHGGGFVMGAPEGLPRLACVLHSFLRSRPEQLFLPNGTTRLRKRRVDRG